MKEKPGRYVLDADLMRCALQGGEYRYDPEIVEKILPNVLILTTREYLDRGFDVFVDDAVLFLKHEQRFDFFVNTCDNFPADNHQCTMLVFPNINVKEAIRRRCVGGCRGVAPEVWGEIFERHMQDLELPEESAFYKVEYVREDQI